MNQPTHINERIANEIRINTAFEQMIVSVLIGASFCGVVLFVSSILAALFGGYVWLDYFVGQFVDALLYTFVIFLAGFLAAAILITPLFVALEKIPYRKTWPFVIAAIVFEFLLYGLFFKDFVGAPARPVWFNISMFAPGVVITLIFGRRMQPFWHAEARMEQAGADETLRLH